MTTRRLRQSRLSNPSRVFVCAGLIGFAASCPAATFYVGSGPGCTHSTIQAAVDAAAGSNGADTIRVAGNASTGVFYDAQAIRIQSQAVTIAGGYELCTSPTPSGVTRINGAGGERNSVFTLTGFDPPVDVRMSGLLIVGGDEADSDDGGGIDFAARGTLYLSDIEISGNRANNGGGISVNAYIDTVLTLGSNVRIINNTALGSGGGIVVKYGELKAESDNLLIAFNSAGDYGGGIDVVGTRRVDIGSPGFGSLPTIFANEARYGGGISVRAGSTSGFPGLVRLYSTDASRPMRIGSNSATNTGGGIYLRPFSAVGLPTSTSTLCASDFRIDDNDAVQGSAIYADSDYSSTNTLRSTQALLNVDGTCDGVAARPPTAQRCTGLPDCNLIDNNYARGDGTPANGATILLQNAGYLDARNLTLRENIGGHAIRAFGDSDDATGRHATVTLRTCLIAENVASRELLRFENSQIDVTLEHCTIAGNVINGASMMRFGSSSETSLTTQRSVLWQPGLPIRAGSTPATLTTTAVLADNLALLSAAVESLVAAPRFIGNGDYRLRAASPAVDFATSAGGTDILGNARGRDLSPKPNRFGSTDLGPYERQSLAPLVINSDFDVDLSVWNPVIAGVTTRDATLNASGASGSGSAKITQVNVPYGQAIRGIQQCVHLPGPGTYAVNGWGRGTGNTTVPGDTAQLHWDYRRDGGEACTNGAAVASGDLILANSANWRRPVTPAFITVSAAEWTSNSSINVIAVGVESGVSGTQRTTSAWFDGITVEALGSDTIFEDGFD